MTSHEISLEALDALGDVDALCLFVAEEDRPLRGTAGFVDWRLCGALSRVLLEGFFHGAEGESLLLPAGGRLPMKRIFVVGIGSRRKLDAAALGRLLSNTSEMLQRAKVPSVAIELPGEGALDDDARAVALRSKFLPAFARARVAVLGDRNVARIVQTG
ncbi:MAG: M17 family peptidase N-terminal domain-containing protein [Myxococcaceae bacterium]